jgi:thioesterase III
METALEIPVRSTEVDFLNHVNNAKYLEYMEWGREDWYRQAGCSFAQLAERSIGTAAVNININYHQECGLGDVLIVKTRPLKVGNSSFVLLQEIYKKESGIKVSDAHVTIVLIDLKTRKSMAIPAYLMKHLC